MTRTSPAHGSHSSLAAPSSQPARTRATLKETWRAMVARPRPFHALLLVICVLLGFSLISQVRAQQSDPLESLSQQDLVSLLDQLSTREETLRATRTDLESQLEELKTSVSRQQAAAQAAKTTQEQAEINAGTVPVFGPGMRVIITDPDNNLRATQFVMMLGELRNAGAEAIEVNGIRLTSHSWFQDGDGTVEADGQKLTSPYTWNIIGDAQTIQTALEIQAGSAQQIRARGASVNVTAYSEVRISSTVRVKDPQFATVVE